MKIAKCRECGADYDASDKLEDTGLCYPCQVKALGLDKKPEVNDWRDTL